MKLTDSVKTRIQGKIKACGREADTIDLTAEWDSTLSFDENWDHLRAHFNLSEPSTKKQEKIEQVQADEEHHKMVMELAEQVEEKERTEIEHITSDNTKIDEYFINPIAYIQTAVNSKEVNSFIYEGEAGIGKTHITLQTLNDLGKKKSIDYEVLAGYCTPLEFYQFLYDNKDKIVVLDDIPNLFENPITYHILLSILWNVTPTRTVFYKSSSEKLKVPEKFEFSGKVIFLTNKLPKETESLKSRCLYYKQEWTYYDKLKVMKLIAKARDMPDPIFKFIEKNTSVATENFNFRTLLKVYGIAQQFPQGWENLAKEQLVNDEYLELVEQLSASYTSIKQAVQAWSEQTGMSRATFFRRKDQLKRVSSIKKAEMGVKL